jgi:hypothetical protein
MRTGNGCERAPQVHYSARIRSPATARQGYTGQLREVKLAMRPLRAAPSMRTVLVGSQPQHELLA